MDASKIFSFTPKPEPEPTPLRLRETPEGKVGLASLSYDVFLNIVDFLIADATRWTTNNAIWKLEYNYAAATKLVVQEKRINLRSYNKCHQIERYRHMLLPSQLNHRTRVMAGKVFPRIPMVDRHGNEMPLKAWIDPVKDRFVLDNSPPSRAQGMHLAQAIMLPTPQGYSLTASIRRISISWGSALHKFEADAVKVLATLPNLEEMSMNMGEFYPFFDQRTVHHGIRAIDPKTYVELAGWAQKHGAAFASASSALKKRGIRVVAGIVETTDPWLEILHTAKGIRIRDLMANCSCCEADKFY